MTLSEIWKQERMLPPFRIKHECHNEEVIMQVTISPYKIFFKGEHDDEFFDGDNIRVLWIQEMYL